jgi:hypothetical protein
LQKIPAKSRVNFAARPAVVRAGSKKQPGKNPGLFLEGALPAIYKKRLVRQNGRHAVTTRAGT